MFVSPVKARGRESEEAGRGKAVKALSAD